MELRHLGRAHGEAAHPGAVDQLPGLVARRVLEGRAAGAALDRLGGLAAFRDLVHCRGNLGGIARTALEQRLREHEVLGRAAVAIRIFHVRVGKHVNGP